MGGYRGVRVGEASHPGLPLEQAAGSNTQLQPPDGDSFEPAAHGTTIEAEYVALVEELFTPESGVAAATFERPTDTVLDDMAPPRATPPRRAWTSLDDIDLGAELRRPVRTVREPPR